MKSEAENDVKFVKVYELFCQLQLYSTKKWCQFLMGIWVWLRAVNVWSTLFLSAFHLHTLRRVAPSGRNLRGMWGSQMNLLLSLSFMWILNLLYSIPAYIFSTNGNENTTEVRRSYDGFICFTSNLLYSQHREKL